MWGPQSGLQEVDEDLSKPTWNLRIFSTAFIVHGFAAGPGGVPERAMSVPAFGRASIFAVPAPTGRSASRAAGGQPVPVPSAAPLGAGARKRACVSGCASKGWFKFGIEPDGQL